MAWDSSRPVPWQRLMRDWLLYVAVMVVVLAVTSRDRLSAGVLGGLLVSGPVFLGIGALLAKFGYQRKTLRQVRRESEERAAAKAAERAAATGIAGHGSSTSRGRPAPTKRTSGGGNRPAQRKKR
jgi:hypothetical protein